MVAPDKQTSNELATERTDLAALRNIMAADRTLMAWVRTGLSMTGFGFTIYKLLQSFQASGAILPNEHSPRHIGLFLTAMGTVSMVMGTIEYWQAMRDLHGEFRVRVWRPAFIMAVVTALLGLFLFVSIFSQVR